MMVSLSITHVVPASAFKAFTYLHFGVDVGRMCGEVLQVIEGNPGSLHYELWEWCFLSPQYLVVFLLLSSTSWRGKQMILVQIAVISYSEEFYHSTPNAKTVHTSAYIKEIFDYESRSDERYRLNKIGDRTPLCCTPISILLWEDFCSLNLTIACLSGESVLNPSD